MTEWIGELFTSDAGWDHLEDLVECSPRMAGSDGERRAAELTRDALAAQDARDARIEPYPIRGWTRETSAITADGRTYDPFALPRSPSTDATGPLIDLGYGLPEDFREADLEGRVALVAMGVPEGQERYVHRNEKYAAAVEGEAAAFVFRATRDGDLAATGSVGTPDDPIGAIPAVGVSKELGLRLVRRHEGEPVTVDVEAAIHETESRNVHAEVGPATDECVLLTAHLDAHDIAEGATDNGAGTAGVIEAVGALATRDDLDTRVHAAVFGAEEINLVGSGIAADRMDHGPIKAVVNADGLAQSRELEVFTHGFDGLGAAAEAVASRFDYPVGVRESLSPYSDHWPFVQWGVPGALVTTETEGALRGWGHTAGDTLDKVEPRTLREQAILLTAYVAEIARDGRTVEPTSPEAMAAALEEEGHAEGMRAIGTWPYN